MTQDDDPREQPELPPTPPPALNPNLLRDRLANERTFLAWMRSGIAITALGFVVARFELLLSELALLDDKEFDDSELALLIGTLLVLAGPVLVSVAAVKFARVERALLGGARGDGAISMRMVVVLTVGLGLAGIGLAIHLVDKWPR
jgi:putative membrane protein